MVVQFNDKNTSFCFLLISFLLSTAKSITSVSSFSFICTGFDYSPAIKGLTCVNLGRHMNMHRCF